MLSRSTDYFGFPSTGYDDVRKMWKETFGDAMIDAAGEIWGLDHERELKGVYRPTGHPGVSENLCARRRYADGHVVVVVCSRRLSSFTMGLQAISTRSYPYVLHCLSLTVSSGLTATSEADRVVQMRGLDCCRSIIYPLAVYEI
jgi:hypothetical protein